MQTAGEKLFSLPFVRHTKHAKKFYTIKPKRCFNFFCHPFLATNKKNCFKIFFLLEIQTLKFPLHLEKQFCCTFKLLGMFCEAPKCFYVDCRRKALVSSIFQAYQTCQTNLCPFLVTNKKNCFKICFFLGNSNIKISVAF